MSMSTSLSLLQRLRNQDDTGAWSLVNQLYTPLLARWARMAGLDDSEAEDVAQDVFIVLMREMADFSYNAQKGKFRSWLKTITFNRARDYQRKKKPDVPGSSVISSKDLANDSPLDRMMEDEFNAFFVSNALRVMESSFEQRSWKACWETTVNSRPAKDVSAELGMSEAAVFVAKSRVLRRLREELGGMMD